MYVPSLAFGITSFLYSLMAFASTYAIKSTQDNDLKLYYISGLLNSSNDTLDEFVVRWALWVLVTPILYINIRPHTTFAWSILVPGSWITAIVTGVQFQVFDGPSPTDILKYAHYGATGFVMLSSSLTLIVLGFRMSGIFWLFTSVVYCTLFLVDSFVDTFDIPSDAFMITEYIFYTFFSLCSCVFIPFVRRLR